MLYLSWGECAAMAQDTQLMSQISRELQIIFLMIKSNHLLNQRFDLIKSNHLLTLDSLGDSAGQGTQTQTSQREGKDTYSFCF